MVFFTCDLCGDSLKKKQVSNHFSRCKSRNFSCMDCLMSFDRISYNDHIKCISENEKYGGLSYVEKPNKGEVKQDLWVQQVREAINRVTDTKLKGILQAVKNHPNIPRKEVKFVNFLKNSLRIYNEALCKKAWDTIKAEANELKLKEEKAAKMFIRHTLFSLCAKKLSLVVSSDQIALLSNYLPPQICNIIKKLQQQILFFNRLIQFPSNLNGKLREKCFTVDSRTLELDLGSSALLLEPFLTRLDFFDLCAKLALDEFTERIYPLLNPEEQKFLLSRDLIVCCRALELSPRPAILHYDDIAISCAVQGLEKALERCLMRAKNTLDTSLLHKCVLFAIKSGHYHIANKIRCDNYSSAFYAIFPDGCIPASFFASLLDSELLCPEVGEQIAFELIEWLPTLSKRRLRRAIECQTNISLGILKRYDAMTREIDDHKNYPCDYD